MNFGGGGHNSSHDIQREYGVCAFDCLSDNFPASPDCKLPM